MKRLSIGVLALTCLLPAYAAGIPKKPKLIVAIVIDQFRYDYLLRFGGEFKGGLKELLDRGAVFDDAHYIHSPTVTAVGHSTFLSGATPSISGIVGNDWFDRQIKPDLQADAAGRCNPIHSSVCDDQTTLTAGVPGAVGSSPRRLLVSTLGDELKMAGRSMKVIGISIKDRGSILPSGHMADAAYWFDADSNRWVTSSYYRETLPDWVKEINAGQPHKKAIGAQWFSLDAKAGDKPFCSMVAGLVDTRYCGSLEASPWGNEMIEDFAEHAITAEKMGHHEGTDLLTVSYSSNDYVGHAVGPDAPDVRDISRRTDLLIGKLLATLDREVGLANIEVVLAADHGVAPVPEVNQERKMPGGRISEAGIIKAVEDGLSTKYGKGRWIAAAVNSSIYFDRTMAAKYKVDETELNQTAARIVRGLPHIFRVYTAEELAAGQAMNDPVGRAMVYGYYGPRSGDLVILGEPYYLFDGAGTSHSTPFDYDNHVPVIFMGPGLKPGHYYEKIAVNDIAPTLAAIAGVETPSGSVGRVLQEMWQ